MHAKPQKFLAARSEMVSNGQFEELAELYHVPFISYHDGVPTVLKNRSQVANSLHEMLSLMKSRGVVGLDVEVTAVEPPRNGKYRVWSQYSEISRFGKVISQTKVVQYFGETSRGTLVEMIESFKCPLAEIWEHKEAASA